VVQQQARVKKGANSAVSQINRGTLIRFVKQCYIGKEERERIDAATIPSRTPNDKSTVALHRASNIIQAEERNRKD
jgi:hypothetical protein